MIPRALAAILLAGAPPTPAAAPPNLLLITIDTLRADRLGAYGYAKAETPALDGLARAGVLVEDATVQAPQTRPSHASILTGLYPYEHGLRDNFSPPLRPGVETLATVLQAKGYDTAAFLGGAPVAAASGLNRGFAVYDDHFPGAGAGLDTLGERRAAAVVDSALAWLARPRTRPFFVWVHLYDPHAPYEPPAPYAQRHPGRPYDGEVAYADAQVGRLLQRLAAAGLRERTLVAATSDHGESLGEHGEEEHLVLVYDATLRVPLVLSWPGTLPAAARVSGQFRSVDLMPTLLGLLGVAPPRTSGVSRAEEVRKGGRLAANESYAESLYGQIHFGWAPLRAIRAEGFKYVEAPRAELYDLVRDPGETRNLIDDRGSVAARMRERLLTFDRGGGTPAAAAPPPDTATLERLAALGYVSSGPAARTAATGADPKDKVRAHEAFHRDSREAVRRFKAGDLDGALPILERLARGDSASFEVDYFLGKALLRKRRFAEAATAFEEAAALFPRFAATWVDLAEAHRRQGRLAAAGASVARGLALFPEGAALHEADGLVKQQAGDLAGARAALEKARTLDPGAGRARLALSAIYRDQGDLPRAVAELQEAVRREPRFADAWNALGTLLAATGQTAGAEAAFRAVLAATPDDPDALWNLAELLIKGGRNAEAVPLLEHLQRVVPGSTEVKNALREATAAGKR
jgi:arylsulfatase A-like enzyme/tetratricopeptide (TPR) repeat protein